MSLSMQSLKLSNFSFDNHLHTQDDKFLLSANYSILISALHASPSSHRSSLIQKKSLPLHRIGIKKSLSRRPTQTYSDRSHGPHTEIELPGFPSLNIQSSSNANDHSEVFTEPSIPEYNKLPFNPSLIPTPSSQAEPSTKASEANMRKRTKRSSERTTYLVAAISSSVGFTALAAGAVVYRFLSQMQSGGEMPYLEMFGTFSLAVGAAVGMEFWARWAHKALWHASLWNMHESHHRPREGPFELNDVFAIINAVPAIFLLAYGFFHKGLFAGLCFGAGLGITLFGMAYMFVHDGLVHRRFPVGPIGKVPYFQRVAAAHQLHHADKFEGVPYGLFLGPQELEIVGGLEDLELILKSRAEQTKKELAKTFTE